MPETNDGTPRRHRQRNIAPEEHTPSREEVYEKFGSPDPVRHAKRRAETKRRVIDVENLREIKDSDYSTRAIDYNPLDAPFLMLVIILLLFGLVMVFSASYAQSIKDYGDASHYFLNQLRWAVIGVGAMLLFAFPINYYRLKKYSNIFLIGTVALLVAVLLMGKEVNDAVRWIQFGGVRFQPSELSKVAVIFFLARWCEDRRSRMKNITCPVTGFLIAVGPTAILLALEPHFSCLILIAATAVVILYAGGMSNKWFWPFVVIGILLVVLFIYYGDKIPVGYISRRWLAWKNPEDYARSTGYQTLQSLMALGTGGFFGVGLGNSRQKQLFLPESHNDYVLSIVGEELGIFGVIVILLLFALLIWRGVTIARRARDRFGFLLVIGIMAKIALQVLINLAVVTNAVPVTGMALPFFSYGGTALMMQLAEIGVVLNISRQTKEPIKL
ncbi:MAG: cell division protein FtsW [Clostridia bacterium]|nr:cell division protein FtsW [Clostridia bacterium]